MMELTPAEREAVISTIMGEARGESYEGKAAVAKVILNRAVQRQDPIRKVLDKSQFNGAGYRGGSKASRAEAEAALDAVLAGEDPAGVGFADHFATNKTRTNWTKKYADTAVQVGSHTFYTSPKAEKFAQEVGAAPVQTAGAFDALFATPTARPDVSPLAQMAMADRAVPRAEMAFTGTPATTDPFSALFNDQAYDPDLPPKDLARLDLALNGRRSDIPSSGIQNKVQDLVTDMWGPDYSVSLYSGQEPEGVEPVGAKHRHPGGFAGDFQFYDPAGQKITDTAKLRDLAQGMAGRHNANIGYSADGSYMPAGNMHIDTMPLDQYQGGAQWGRTAGGEWADLLNQSRAQGSMPAAYYKWDQISATPPEKPSPEMAIASMGPMSRPRNEPQAMMSSYSGPTSRPAVGQQMASVDPTAGVSSRGATSATGLSPLGQMAAPQANTRVAGAFDSLTQQAKPAGPSMMEFGFSGVPGTFGFTSQTTPAQTVAPRQVASVAPMQTAPVAQPNLTSLTKKTDRLEEGEDKKPSKRQKGEMFGDLLIGSMLGGPVGAIAAGALNKYGGVSPTRGLIGVAGDIGGGIGSIFGGGLGGLATAEGFNQTQWGQARNAGFVDGVYDSNRALNSGLFAGDMSAEDWASRSALDQRDRAENGGKTWGDAFSESFGSWF